MRSESLLTDDWPSVVERLGGSDFLEQSASQTGALRRRRSFSSAVDLLRLILGYCLGDHGLRLTAAWAASVGLADISNVALLKRLRCSDAWLSAILTRLLELRAPAACEGRLIRIVDATVVSKAAQADRARNGVWRIHAGFDVPHEAFCHFELTDESGGERLDRIPVHAGEIRLGDRAYMQPERMAGVMEAGADFIVRAVWKGARWLDEAGQPFDLIAALQGHADEGPFDQPVRIGRKKADPLNLRLVACRKPPEAAARAREQACKAARKGGHKITEQTLIAAGWVILVTSLDPDQFSAQDVLALYRLRWRIELAFKRLKSLIGLKTPPGTSETSARPWVLAHLIMALLLEPLTSEFEVSPHSARDD
ncbi:MAG: IS4 family transposase [Pannonibacter phragmitetus]